MESQFKRGELIVAEIKEIHPNSIELKIIDSGKKGFLNVSNIPGLWIRDLKKSMKKGQLIVGKIINIDHLIELSLKGVSKQDKERKLKEYSLETKSVRLFRKVCEESGISPKLVENEIKRIKDSYGNVYRALELIRKGDKVELDKPFEVVYSRFSVGVKTYEFKGELELHSNSGKGLEEIKESLSGLKDANATYIGNTKFLLKLTTTNPKQGQKNLLEEAEKVITRIKKVGGIGEFKPLIQK